MLVPPERASGRRSSISKRNVVYIDNQEAGAVVLVSFLFLYQSVTKSKRAESCGVIPSGFRPFHTEENAFLWIAVLARAVAVFDQKRAFYSHRTLILLQRALRRAAGRIMEHFGIYVNDVGVAGIVMMRESGRF